ncbi:MAG: hypothetical protein OXG42_01530 [Chloroflexi bacterium]|nr:hypothetical protein [Chloroflexota bacterium]
MPKAHMRTSEELGAKARALYESWRAEGLNRQQIDGLLVDLRCLHDMERDAVPNLPRSDMGSAAASMLEG